MMSFTGADFIRNFRMSRDTFIHTPKHFSSFSQQESEVRQEMYKLHKLTGLLAKKPPDWHLVQITAEKLILYDFWCSDYQNRTEIHEFACSLKTA